MIRKIVSISRPCLECKQINIELTNRDNTTDNIGIPWLSQEH